MELRHLRYFVAVADALSFTKAAQKLRLAQPSLTRQVRNLEDEIGVRLFSRANNRVTLTDEGRAFLVDSRKVLALSAESIATVQRMQHGECTQLDIGYVANIHHGLLPATLGAFRKIYPEVVLNLFDLRSDEQIQALEKRRIDLGFIGLGPELSGQEFCTACVAQDTMRVALPTSHSLTLKPRIKLGDLASQFFISMSAKTYPGAREWLVAACQRAGFVPRILQEAESEPDAIRFVANGLGVALLSEQSASLPHKGVVFLPLTPSLRRESTIVWRADNVSKPLQNYIRIVKDLSRSM